MRQPLRRAADHWPGSNSSGSWEPRPFATTPCHSARGRAIRCAPAIATILLGRRRGPFLRQQQFLRILGQPTLRWCTSGPQPLDGALPCLPLAVLDDFILQTLRIRGLGGHELFAEPCVLAPQLFGGSLFRRALDQSPHYGAADHAREDRAAAIVLKATTEFNAIR